MNLTRRQFLRGAGAVSGTAALPSIFPFSLFKGRRQAAPNARLGVALIGHGAMGRGHLRRLLDDRAVQVLAVCDVDGVRRDEALRRAQDTYALNSATRPYRTCKAYNDYREILARPDIDAVVIATPDHWHTPMSIDAAKAGKDIYCEKPISVCVQEGRELVQAVQRSGRVFQTGTQYRSIPVIRQVCDFVRAGGLGRVKSVFTLWNSLSGWLHSERFKPYVQALDLPNNAGSFVPLDLPLPAEEVPPGLDWDLWVGPAAWHDYNRTYHINPSPGVVPWAFCEDFGAASVTWFHSHAADVIQYALGFENSGPAEFIHPGSGQYPTLTCKYANGVLLHLVEHWGEVKTLYKAVPPTATLSGNFGGIFVGERGWVTSLSAGGPIEGGPPEIFKEMRLATRQVAIGTNTHHANWFQCIRTRARPSADEEIGHRSASLGHLTIIAYRLGRSLKWNPATEQFLDDPEANRLLSRARREPWRI